MFLFRLPRSKNIFTFRYGSQCLKVWLPKSQFSTLVQNVKPILPDCKAQMSESCDQLLSYDTDKIQIISCAFDNEGKNIVALFTSCYMVHFSYAPRDGQFQQKAIVRAPSKQENIYWNSQEKCWITTDHEGSFSFFDQHLSMPEVDLNINEEDRKVETIYPYHFHQGGQGTGHSQRITDYCEVGQHYFVTSSLDRTIIMWDIRQKTTEMIQPHPTAVLSVAYMPLHSLFFSAPCEKSLYCWSVDDCAFRGPASIPRLDAHDANLIRVCASNHLFFTLTETSYVRAWDPTTMVCLHTVGGFPCNFTHMVPVPQHSRLMLAGKRFYFFEGNEKAAPLMLPDVQQTETATTSNNDGNTGSKQAEEVIRIHPAKWSGVHARSGLLLTATDYDVQFEFVF